MNNRRQSHPFQIPVATTAIGAHIPVATAIESQSGAIGAPGRGGGRWRAGRVQ